MNNVAGQLNNSSYKNDSSANTFGLVPQSLDQALELANIIAGSNFAPKDYKGKPHDVLLAMQMGAEVGLKPMQAIQNIAVINGRPCLWGDALLAVVRVHKSFEWIKETDDGSTATCIIKREGSPEHVTTFSIDDAKKAGLAAKPGPWTQSPKRMRQLRARAFCCRDTFPDALKGLDSAEIVSDYEKIEKDITPKVKSERLNTLIDSIDSGTEVEKISLTPEQTIDKMNCAMNKNELVLLLPNITELPEEEKIRAREIYKNKMTEFANAENSQQ